MKAAVNGWQFNFMLVLQHFFNLLLMIAETVKHLTVKQFSVCKKCFFFKYVIIC